MIQIDIHDDGEHWHKTVKIFGITVYRRHDYTKNNKPRPTGFNSMAQIPGEIEDEDYWEDKKTDMEEPKTKVMQHGEIVAVESNAKNFGIIFNVSELLAVQAKYTGLQCECKRFADYVMNLTHGSDVTALQFDDEYLRMAGDMLFKFFGHLPKTDLKEIIKELKK